MSHTLVKNLEVRKGCFIFECTVLDLNCDRLRELQFGTLCSYWLTLKVLPALVSHGKKKYTGSSRMLRLSLMGLAAHAFTYEKSSVHWCVAV